jgi:hypothetical protein
MRKLCVAVGSFVLFMLLAQLALAAEPERIISNSADWKDVYSVMLYGSLIGKSATFLVSDRHAVIMADSLPTNAHVWIISSKSVPYTRGYGNYLQSKGFTSESFDYDNVNLELAKKVTTTSFVIVDPSYGYNAISVAPYAVISNSYVLFANAKTIDQVDSFLTDRKASKIIIYGHVDRAVKTALAKYGMEEINLDGDRFANNIEIVKRYEKLSAQKQVILTNGEFIEQEIMSGKEPVIFIGRDNVPDVVRKYIGESSINVGVLIGNELVNTATFIRRQIGISVFVKFARSARAPGTAIAPVEALDMFYLPVYQLNLQIDSLTYNKATKQLEIVLRNTRDQAAYFKGTYTITNPDGTMQTVGDADAIFIEPNSYQTVTYYLDTGLADGATVAAYIIYGESKNSLEYVIDEQFCPTCEKKYSQIDVIDNCNATISKVSYNIPRQLFYVDVKNTGSVACFADVALIDVVVAAEKVTYQYADVASLAVGEMKSPKIKGALVAEDIPDNELVTGRLFYGERKNSLVKESTGQYPLEISNVSFSFMTIASYAMLVVIVLIILLIIWGAWKRRRKKKQ